MSSEPMLFEPEVEAILREIASDPRSSLLRVSRPQHLKGLFERYTNVGPQTAGLTAAERHLLQVHRNEVARLFGDVCRRRLTVGHRAFNRSLTVGSEVRIPEEREIRERSKELQSIAGGLAEPGIEDLLDRCVSGEADRQPSVAALAASMARLKPDDAARVLAACDLAFRKQPRASLKLLYNVLGGDPSPLMASVAWDNAGYAYELLNAHDDARRAFRTSGLGRVSRVFPVLVWMQFAFVQGLEAEAFRSAERLNDLVGPNDKTVEWYVSSLVRWREAREWTAEARGRNLAQRVRDRLDGSAGRLADAWT